VFASSALV
jgi:site-specific recombinase XerD